MIGVGVVTQLKRWANLIRGRSSEQCGEGDDIRAVGDSKKMWKEVRNCVLCDSVNTRALETYNCESKHL